MQGPASRRRAARPQRTREPERSGPRPPGRRGGAGPGLGGLRWSRGGEGRASQRRFLTSPVGNRPPKFSGTQLAGEAVASPITLVEIQNGLNPVDRDWATAT